MRLVREDDHRVVCEGCDAADTFLTRLRGLLGKRALPQGQGLLLHPASSIHMFFMRFPIDAVFLDRELRVVAVRSNLAPWRVAAVSGSRYVLELAAGEAEHAGLRPGHKLVLREEEGDEAAEH
jgi:uncharacterized membrane protein (UPF0127 family)